MEYTYSLTRKEIYLQLREFKREYFVIRIAILCTVFLWCIGINAQETGIDKKELSIQQPTLSIDAQEPKVDARGESEIEKKDLLIPPPKLKMDAPEQEIDKSGLTIREPRLRIDGFSYSGLESSLEEHSYFTLNYKVGKKGAIELRGQYDTYLSAIVFKLPILAKLYVSDKFFIFSGFEVELEQDIIEVTKEIKPQLRSIYGMGYDVNDNFTIEARQNIDFNTQNSGKYGTKSQFSLGGKYRF